MPGIASTGASARRLVAMAAAVATAASFVAPLAVAQVEPPRVEKDVTLGAPEITVFAPEVVRRRVGVGRFGNPIEVVSLTRTVSYADLDLGKPQDAAELRRRIRATANEACRELDRRAPSNLLLGPHPDVCVREATTQALVLAGRVIAAARATPR